MQIDAEQLEIIREALGDAVAYRNDSGEADEGESEAYELEALARYRQLAGQLGLELQ